VLIAVAGALVLVFACYGFSPDAFSYLSAQPRVFSGSPSTRRGGSSLRWAMLASTCLCCRSGALPGLRRSRYFGNTTPLLCALVLILLVMTGAPALRGCGAALSATFVGGVFADAYEGQGAVWRWLLPGRSSCCKLSSAC